VNNKKLRFKNAKFRLVALRSQLPKKNVTPVSQYAINLQQKIVKINVREKEKLTFLF